MFDVHVLALDLAKRSFQVCGTARGGAVLFNRTVSRAKLGIAEHLIHQPGVQLVIVLDPEPGREEALAHEADLVLDLPLPRWRPAGRRTSRDRRPTAVPDRSGSSPRRAGAGHAAWQHRRDRHWPTR